MHSEHVHSMVASVVLAIITTAIVASALGLKL